MIDEDPTIYLDAKGGVPQEERQALTDEQVEPVSYTHQMCIRDRFYV